jgi:hypothetical protein
MFNTQEVLEITKEAEDATPSKEKRRQHNWYEDGKRGEKCLVDTPWIVLHSKLTCE